MATVIPVDEFITDEWYPGFTPGYVRKVVVHDGHKGPKEIAGLNRNFFRGLLIQS